MMHGEVSDAAVLATPLLRNSWSSAFILLLINKLGGGEGYDPKMCVLQHLLYLESKS